MIRLFIDSDVVMDFLAEREPHYAASAGVFSAVQSGKYAAVTTPIVYANLFYLLERRYGATHAVLLLRKLRLLLGVAEVGEETVEMALSSGFSDFEDALQYYAALSAKTGFLLTRNRKDYAAAKGITVCSPAEFLVLQKRGKKDGGRNPY